MKDNKEIENLKKFKIPQNHLDKFFEFTGNSDDELSRGFIMAYVNGEGFPVVYTKIASPIIELGLLKALETYLNQKENISIEEENNEDNITEM